MVFGQMVQCMEKLKMNDEDYIDIMFAVRVKDHLRWKIINNLNELVASDVDIEEFKIEVNKV